MDISEEFPSFLLKKSVRVLADAMFRLFYHNIVSFCFFVISVFMSVQRARFDYEFVVDGVGT